MKQFTRIAAVLVCLFAALAASGQGLRRLNRPGGLRRPGGPAANAANAAANAAGGEAKTTEEQLKEIPKGTNGVPTRLAFDQAPVELLLYAYADVAGKILIPAPNLPKAQITLKTMEDRELTKEEYLEAIEVTLTMNGVVLEPFDRIFLRAFERKSVRTKGIRTSMNMPTEAIAEKGRVISQLIRLEHITAEEAQKAIEGFKDPDAAVQVFERTNTILVTDTQENVNRMLEVIKELDVANPVLEEVFVRQIENALATDIKTALETIVTESQKDSQQAKSGPKESGAPGFGSRNAAPAPVGGRLLGLGNRPGLNQPPPAPTPNAVMTAQVSDADRGMIRGKVLILADERSNKLIVITMKSNMNFFDTVIKELDVPTTPEVSVEVVRLKYADAEEVSSMLNDLIGNGSSSSQSKNNQNAAAQKGGAANKNLTPGSRQPMAGRTPTANPTFSKSASTTLGELNKDNIKILADKRINGVVVMARKADMKAVKEVIEDMDVKLSQVLLETVIIQIELGDELTTGIDWVQRGRSKQSVQATDRFGRGLFYATDDRGNVVGSGVMGSEYKYKDADGNEVSSTIGEDAAAVMKKVIARDGFFNNGSYMLGGGGGSSSGPLGTLMNVAAAGATSEVATAANPIGGGVNYLLKSDKLNIAAVINASKGDSRTKVLASPILMTVDNKEATIEATDMIYLFAGYQYSGSSYSGTQVRNYEKRDIGLTVKVTPKINPNGTVMLTIEETIESQGADQNVPNESGGTDPYATVVTRKMSSDISVENRQTVIMGGLTKTTKTESESGIPLLKDIPWVGKWLFGSTSFKDQRSELLVFITPYVLDDASAAQFEAMRRKKTLSDPRPWEDNGWSASPLADPVSKKEQLRRFNDEWARQDEERKTKLAIEKAKLDRAKKLRDMSAEEREYWLKLHKDELEKEGKKEEAEALEKRMGDKQEQETLREFVEQLKKDRLDDANREIKAAETAEKNEYRKDLERRVKDGEKLPAGETIKRDADAVKREGEAQTAQSDRKADQNVLSSLQGNGNPGNSGATGAVPAEGKSVPAKE